MLSGGGARGAYEAGVLSALVGHVRPGAPVADVVCGTSVGAMTGAFLAAEIDAPLPAARELERLWSSLDIDDVLGFGLRQLPSLPRLLLGGASAAGLFDVRSLEAVLTSRVRWGRIHEHLAAGRLRAFTVTATHVPTGRPTIFVQRRADVAPPEAIGQGVSVRDAEIGPAHVLASGAIPILFPPVSVDGELHCDGGLRMNTPLGPAIRLGATRVLVTTLSTARPEPELPDARYPGAAFLLGKVLNAFLLDHVLGDLDELYRINRFLEDGREVYGDAFESKLAALAASRGRPAYHVVQAHVVRPSEDIGVIAADHLRRLRLRVGRGTAVRNLLRLVDSPGSRSSDLASYLLFDPGFAEELIALGRSDARAHEDEWARFFDDTPCCDAEAAELDRAAFTASRRAPSPILAIHGTG